MIRTYGEFVSYVEKVGVMAFYGKFIDGFPKIQDLTTDEQWHTSDPETDPWQWKDRIATERKLAFGCVFGGSKGFISKRYYSLFYAACRPQKSLEEAYFDGIISPMELNMYKLFENGYILSTADIRTLLGVTKENSSRADSAIVALQRDFYITVCGNKRKVSKSGEEYGWPANTYCRVEDWIPDWIVGADKLNKEEARKEIIHLFAGLIENPDEKNIEKQLFRKCRL